MSKGGEDTEYCLTAHTNISTPPLIMHTSSTTPTLNPNNLLFPTSAHTILPPPSILPTLLLHLLYSTFSSYSTHTTSTSPLHSTHALPLSFSSSLTLLYSPSFPASSTVTRFSLWSRRSSTKAWEIHSDGNRMEYTVTGIRRDKSDRDRQRKWLRWILLYITTLYCDFIHYLLPTTYYIPGMC